MFSKYEKPAMYTFWDITTNKFKTTMLRSKAKWATAHDHKLLLPQMIVCTKFEKPTMYSFRDMGQAWLERFKATVSEVKWSKIHGQTWILPKMFMYIQFEYSTLYSFIAQGNGLTWVMSSRSLGQDQRSNQEPNRLMHNISPWWPW